jgi:hypothetical protein
VSPEGVGVDFNEQNVPYRPKAVMKISLEGFKEGDFTFVMGYPGRTYRNSTLAELRSDTENMKKRTAQFKEIIAFYEEAGKTNKDVEIRYASRVKGLLNSLKNMQGKLEGMEKIALLDKKSEQEKAFLAWAGGDQERQKKYGDALERISAYMKKSDAFSARNELLASAVSSTFGATLLAQGHTIYRTVQERQKPDKDREPAYQDRNMTYIKMGIQLAERGYEIGTDKAFFKRQLKKMMAFPEEQTPAAFKELFRQKSEKAVDDYVDALYSNTVITIPEKRLKLLEMKPAELAKLEDPMIRLAGELEKEIKVLREESKGLGQERADLKMVYEEALLKMKDGKMAPDANGTLRFTYGPVAGYSPKDAVCYLPQTTLKGVIEKDTGAFPFAVPGKIKELAASRDFGPYADSSLNDVPVCFLNTTNVTGGNSGSATLNARGEQVGIIFDMTYESVIGDYYIIPELQRSISVDIRYVLFVTEKFSGATHIIKELGL